MKTNIVLCLVLLSLFPANSYGQDEPTILRDLFSSSFDITKLSTEVISLAVDAVWEASGATGTVTTTGTLTQSQSNPNVWNYSSSPGDKLLVVFTGGPTIVFVFYQINGYTEGTSDDFKYSHQMDFNTFVENYINLRIVSNTNPQNGIIHWVRNITGTFIYNSIAMTLNLNHTGDLNYEVDAGFAMYEYSEQAAGSTTTSANNVSVNETYWKKFIHNSNQGVFVSNTEITNNSSGVFSGTSYQFQNARVFWAAWTEFADSAFEGVYNQVVDSYQWAVQGVLLKNGSQYGTLMFSGPVVDNTYGPDLIVHLNNGSNIFLHSLIGLPVSDIAGEDLNPNNFELYQNYPNPFNSETVIRWNMDRRNDVTIKIYDVLGTEMMKIIDEDRPEGLNEVHFRAEGLPSGVYFYVLSSGQNSAYRKMVLVK